MGDRGGGGGVGRQSSYLYLAQHTHTHSLACIAQTAQKATRGTATLTNTHLHVSWWQVVQWREVSSFPKRKLSSLKLQNERAGVSSPRTGRPGGGGCARGVTRPLCPEPLSFDGRSRLSILLLLLLLLAAHLLSIQTRACSEDNRGEQADSYKMLPSRGSWRECVQMWDKNAPFKIWDSCYVLKWAKLSRFTASCRDLFYVVPLLMPPTIFS